MKPTTVMCQLMWIFGRSDRYISRHLNWPPYLVHCACRPVWNLRGVAR